MKKCTCTTEYNISEAEINIRSPHDISITIQREAANPTIASLRKRIEDLEVFNLHIDDEIDRRLGERIGELDLVTRAALAELLSTYSTKEELDAITASMQNLILQERAYNDSRFLQKAYVTQAQYDAMQESDKNDNTIYVIRG